MRRLVLVRHGESVWNAERRIQGQSCAGLSARGHEQAAATATTVVAAYPGAYLVTSDLRRTRETAAPFEAAYGVEAEVDPLLRERAFGTWEGRLRDEVAAEDPDRWRRWGGGEDLVAEVGGESSVQLGDRVAARLRALLEATAEDGTTVAVTHGGPIWQGVHRVLDLPLGTFAGVDNASLHELVTFDGGRSVSLGRWNETGHLPVGLRTGWAPSSSSDGASGAPPLVGR